MIAGYDRYFQIARCFRDEDLRADRQPEFTQIDIEASFVQQRGHHGRGRRAHPRACSRRAALVHRPSSGACRTRDAMEHYGTDRPDLRFGLELFDASDVFRATEFGIARSAIGSGGRVRGLRLPGAAGFSRKQVDELEEIAKSAGAGGLIRLKRNGDVVDGPAAKFLGPDAAARLALADGDLALFVAGPDRVSSPALDRVRHESARRLSLVREAALEFLWVVDFPLFERDADDGRAEPPPTIRSRRRTRTISSFSRAIPAACAPSPTMSSSMGRSSAAGASASTTRPCRSGCSACSASTKPRHGCVSASCWKDCGPARRRMAESRSDSIGSRCCWLARRILRDVIAFPKTTAARALFEGAPSAVPSEDLDALHIRVAPDRK